MDSRKPPDPTKVIPLKKSVTVAFNDYDIEGKPQWLLYDHSRNKFFLIGWLEFEMIERWGLESKESIINSINNETTIDVTDEDLDSFLDFLKRNYLIEQSGYEIDKLSKEQGLFTKKDSLYQWMVGSYLFFRIPLVKPDYFLRSTLFIANFIFSRAMGVVMTILGIIAIYLIGSRWEMFTTTFANVFTTEGLIFSMIGFLLMKLCHELGHAYMCRRFNIPVTSLGIAFMVFWPVLYTDTTLSWSLPSKQRFMISIAGVWVETYIAIIAAFVWYFSTNQTIETIAYITITVNWLATILINISPFLRFDGYHIMADSLKMPNLQPRAFALTRWQIRKTLFGWDDEPPEIFAPALHATLIIYSICTWLYRLVLFIGIALLVYYMFAKVIGLILFVIEIYYFILAPIVNEVKFWMQYKDKFTFNRNTIITTIVAVILVGLLFVPFGKTLKLPATLSYMHSFLYAPEAGTLNNDIPPPGTKVKKLEPIVSIDSEKLTQAILETELEYTKAVNELRRAAVSDKFISKRAVLLSDINKLKEEHSKLLKIKEKLVLEVKFDGVITETEAELKKGSYVKKNQWLGDVIDPDKVVVEAFASQKTVHLVKTGVEGHFYPVNINSPAVPVKVTTIEIMNAKQLDCKYSSELQQQKDDNIVIETPCYNASDLGGEISAEQTAEGKYVPTESVFRIVLKPTGKTSLKRVERGVVHLDILPESYASRLWYWVKSILIGESEF